MNILWRIIYSLIIGSLTWLLHRKIGAYPQPLPRSENPKRAIGEVLLLWGVAIFVPILMLHGISPWLDRAVSNGTLRELIQVPLRTLLYVAPPLLIIYRRDKRAAKDWGITWKCQSGEAATFAIIMGLATGCISYATGQSNINLDRLSFGELILLLYNNSFIEEFFYRGVIQSRLEMAVGQKRAIFWGGVVFGMTHIVFDISMLAATEGWAAVCLAVLLQTIAGWMWGIIFMKTRTLWPGIACHYLANWLPSILVNLFG